MLPLSDTSRGADGRASPLPIATLTYMALLALGFALELAARSGFLNLPLNLAFVPGLLFGGAELPIGVPVFPPPATLVTYQFLHSGWVHLLSNLLFIWVFGPQVEDSLGPGRFTVLIFLTGIAAALAQAAANPESPVPIIGASGGVSGIMGAYLLLHPHSEIRILVPVLVMLDVVRLPAFVVLAAWFALQVFYSFWFDAGMGGIAFWAHIGGFVAGILFAPVLNYLALSSAKDGTFARPRWSRDSRH